jgi:hypothetical protein
MSTVVRSLFSGAVLAVALVAPAPAPAAITPEAAKVVARYVEAAGGEAAVRGVKTTHIVTKIAAFGLEGTSEIWAQAPDRRAERTEIGPFKLSQAVTGATGWRTDPTGKFSVLDGKDLEEAQSNAWFENDRWLEPDQGGGTIAVVQEPEAGSAYVVLEVSPPSGRARRFWFSKSTGLIDKATTKRDQQSVVSTFSDYRETNGRKMPWQQKTQIIGMPANDLTVTLQSVELNGEVAAAVFEPPAQSEKVTYLKTPGVATLPFEYRGRHVWLRASVNGKPLADFLYDTGASVTVLDSAYAASIGVTGEGTLHSQGAGSTGAASLAKISTLKVESAAGDGVEMKDQSVAILSINPFLAPFFWRDCAGVIGYDFITRFVNEVDFDARVLTLRDPKTFKYEGKGAKIPMQIAGTVPVIAMKIDGQYEGEFRVDVGSSSTVDLHSPFVAKHGLQDKAKTTVAVVGGGFGGTFHSKLTRMTSIEIGPFSWKEPLVVLSGATAGALASEDYAGNVGNQILERFKATFDYDGRALYLEPGAQYAKRDQFSLSGVQLARLDGKVKAMQVVPGSPSAKAGLREGDVVVGINGKDIGAYSQEELRKLMEDSKPGEKFAVEVEREGKKKKITMKLAEIL